MKKAICLLGDGDPQAHIKSIIKAKTFADSKDYRFSGILTTDEKSLIEDGNRMLQILQKQGIDIILSDNLLPLAVMIAKGETLFEEMKNKGLEWYDVDSGCMINEWVENQMTALSKHLESTHVSILVISKDMNIYKENVHLNNIIQYVKENLKQSGFGVFQYKNETDNLRDALIDHIVETTPDYIIVDEDVQNESINNVLNLLKKNCSYDIIISYDEIEQALEENELALTINGIQN